MNLHFAHYVQSTFWLLLVVCTTLKGMLSVRLTIRQWRLKKLQNQWVFFIGDWSSTQHTQSIIIKGDVLIYLPVYMKIIFEKIYLYYSNLGCYALVGPLYYDNNISECYQRCLHKQHNSFKYFSYKVTRLELFFLF